MDNLSLSTRLQTKLTAKAKVVAARRAFRKTVLFGISGLSFAAVIGSIVNVSMSQLPQYTPDPYPSTGHVASPAQASTPVNPLGGEVYLGEGKAWGNKDSKVWLCSDPKGGEWECSDMAGMTPAQARKDRDEAIARNNEREANEKAREEYGKAVYGNCPLTGCKGL